MAPSHHLHGLWDRADRGTIDSSSRLHWARAVLHDHGSAEVMHPVIARSEWASHVYAAGYLDALDQAADVGVWLDPELYLDRAYLHAAHSACQMVCEVAEAAWSGDTGARVWCLTRPGSHHASDRRAMGGCVLNNLAAAARRTLATGAGKVAVVDFDAHHGNGTADIFHGDPRVLCASMHQYPFFPGTGTGVDGPANLYDEPLPAGAQGLPARDAYRRLLGRVADFEPDIVLFEAGLDGHHQDPTSDLAFTVEDFREFGHHTRILLDALGVPAVFELGGGYSDAAVTEGLDGYLRGLEGTS